MHASTANLLWLLLGVAFVKYTHVPSYRRLDHTLTRHFKSYNFTVLHESLSTCFDAVLMLRLAAEADPG